VRRARKKKLEQGVTLAAGTAMVGLGACDEGFRVCDPPPPPLCDSLDLDPLLRMEADRTQAALTDSILFTGVVDRTLVQGVEGFWVDPGAGTVSGTRTVPPDSLAFRWTPRDPGGGFRPGTHDLVVRLDLRFRAETSAGTRCDDADTVRVEIDESGNATVLSLPGAKPLSVYFRVALEVSEVEGGYRLTASTSLPAEAMRDVTWSWRTTAGTLSPDGGAARYVPDPRGEPGVVQVEARLGERGLALATWIWPGGR
jgi:hypothetical protein